MNTTEIYTAHACELGVGGLGSDLGLGRNALQGAINLLVEGFGCLGRFTSHHTDADL